MENAVAFGANFAQPVAKDILLFEKCDLVKEKRREERLIVAE